MVDKRVDVMFGWLRSKYCSWWDLRVDTPEKLAAEREAWASALAGLSVRQIGAAKRICRQRYQYRAPTAVEFLGLVAERDRRPINRFIGVRVDRPVASARSKQFFAEIRGILSGER